jgi:hypothetical protein
LNTATGSKIWETTSIPGVCAGSPQTSEQGRHVVTTHNEDGQGHFSLFDTKLIKQDSNKTSLSPLFTYTNSTNPFSPLGFFHNPEEGYYDSPNDAGYANRNDIFIWGFDTNIATQTGSNVKVGVGQMFGFQFPVNYNPDADGSAGLSVLILGQTRSWQSSTRPILANSGRSMYWALTRAEQRCWIGQFKVNANKFSRADTATVSLSRRGAATSWMAAQAPPTLSSDPVTPVVYGPGVSNEFFRFNYNYSDTLIVSTDSFISSRAVLTPDDRFVFYGTQNGILYQASGKNLTTVWKSSSSVSLSSIYGDLAMHPSGSHVYVGDNSRLGKGNIVAIQIAQSTLANTSSPTTVATAVPAPSPTKGNATTKPASGSGTSAPAAKTARPAPTRSPVRTPTAAPTVASTTEATIAGNEKPPVKSSAGIAESTMMAGALLLSFILLL